VFPQLPAVARLPEGGHGVVISNSSNESNADDGGHVRAGVLEEGVVDEPTERRLWLQPSLDPRRLHHAPCIDRAEEAAWRRQGRVLSGSSARCSRSIVRCEDGSWHDGRKYQGSHEGYMREP